MESVAAVGCSPFIHHLAASTHLIVFSQHQLFGLNLFILNGNDRTEPHVPAPIEVRLELPVPSSSCCCASKHRVLDCPNTFLPYSFHSVRLTLLRTFTRADCHWCMQCGEIHSVSHQRYRNKDKRRRAGPTVSFHSIQVTARKPEYANKRCWIPLHIPCGGRSHMDT